jgi:hypothetical protein
MCITSSNATKEANVMPEEVTPTECMSKSDALTRLRQAAKLARRAAGSPSNAIAEVGWRTVPTTTLSAPTTYSEAYELCYPEGDDLDGVEWFASACRVMPIGAVVHLYVNEDARPEGYLNDIVVCWLGVKGEPPRIIDTRFVKYGEG